ncbi:hypothetical protein ACF06X_26805 [Streptomyces sp. NPDC015346]|uniref:hypothetical protein n=1 Tax=Streptomyces sp. NPDC015346 TaxID=3364954 RepID=UPI0036F577A3
MKDAGIQRARAARPVRLVPGGWDPAKTSRILNAKAAPSDTDLRAWCDACRALDQAADLIAMRLRDPDTARARPCSTASRPQADVEYLTGPQQPALVRSVGESDADSVQVLCEVLDATSDVSATVDLTGVAFASCALLPTPSTLAGALYWLAPCSTSCAACSTSPARWSCSPRPVPWTAPISCAGAQVSRSPVKRSRRWAMARVGWHVRHRFLDHGVATLCDDRETCARAASPRLLRLS